jgi:hypothetical protein
MSIAYTFTLDGLAVACWHNADGTVRIVVANRDGIDPIRGTVDRQAVKSIVDLDQKAAAFLSRALVCDPDITTQADETGTEK